MGYASYLEDIVDRFNEDLIRPVENLLSDPQFLKQIDAEHRISVFLEQYRLIMTDLRRHLDLATDPEVDLADEIFKLRKQNDELIAFRKRTEEGLAGMSLSTQFARERDRVLLNCEKLQSANQLKFARERDGVLLKCEKLQSANRTLKRAAAEAIRVQHTVEKSLTKTRRELTVVREERDRCRKESQELFAKSLKQANLIREAESRAKKLGKERALSKTELPMLREELQVEQQLRHAAERDCAAALDLLDASEPRGRRE